MSRILNGMWQVSGAHGFDPNKEKAVADMAHYADEGIHFRIYICMYIVVCMLFYIYDDYTHDLI